jgi:hypothetical protein
MRLKDRNLTLILAVLLSIALASLGCQGSNSVTGPPAGTVSSSSSVAGTWNGNFMSDDLSSCGGSTATATFEQVGSTVTGKVATSSCGVSGYFKGTVQGNMLIGSIAMEGCVGGGVSGTINGSELSLSISDLTKPLVTGERPLMLGGVATLRR